MNRSIVERINAIEPKTLAGKLREALPAIDRKLRENVSYAEIIEALRAEGIDVQKATLKSYVVRYRKRMKGDDAKPVPHPHPRSSASLPEGPEPSRPPNDGGTRAIRNMINEEVDLDQWTRTAREAKRKSNQ